MSEKNNAYSIKLWNRYFILICIVGLFTSVAMQMLNSTLSNFANDMWASKTLGGYLTTAFNIGGIVMAFFSGPIVSRAGCRRCLVGATILFSAATLICVVTTEPTLCLLSRLIQGISKGIITVSATSLVAAVTPRERMSEGIGLYGLGQTLGMAFGPMIGLNLTNGGSYVVFFIVCAVLYCAAGIVSLGLNFEKDPRFALQNPAANSTPAADSGKYKGIWKLIDKNALPPAISYTIFFASYSCILVFLSVYSTEILGFSATKTSTFYTVAAISMFLVRMFCGKLADKHGPLTLIVPGHIAVLIMLVMITFFAKDSYIIFLICGALYGICSPTVLPALNAVAIVDSPKDRSSVANATFYFMQDFGILFSSLLFGNLIDAISTPDKPALGYQYMFMISAGICALSLISCVLLYNNKRRRKKALERGE